MAISIDGSNNTISGLAVGGLPNGIVDTDMLAAGAATQAKRTYAVGEIVQVVRKPFINNHSGMGLSGDISSATYVDLGTMEIDITPKFASSKLIFETDFNARVDATNGHSKYDIYDSTNNRYFISTSGNDCGIAEHYGYSTSAYPSIHVRIEGSALYTTQMTLKLRVKLNSGGSLNCDFSTDDRIMTVMEIKQ